ncbi:MAG: glycosyl hydrolase family 65 protein, partial [Halanaerobacter sp.]
MEGLANEIIYEIDPWQIIETEFDIESNYRDETIFALGNGYIGMRGNFEEGYFGPDETSLEGIYLNGFYEKSPLHYSEEQFGYAQSTETMLNVTDSKIVKLYLGDEEFDLLRGEVIDYQRRLNLKKGLLTREMIWESPQGKRVEIKIERLVSFTNQHLAAINYQIIPLNFSGEVSLISALDAAVTNYECEDDPRVSGDLAGQVLNLKEKIIEDDFLAVKQQVANAGFDLVCGIKNELETADTYQVERNTPEQKIEEEYIIQANEGIKTNLTKYISYYTSRDYENVKLVDGVQNSLDLGSEKGFWELKKEQQDYLDEFWEQANVEIEGADRLQQGLRFNQFHLLQSVGRDGQTNIAAKGVTGEGYEGHYFWDTEIYSLPFFLYLKPEISRKLLEFRYNTLDKARERARTMGHQKGALYPWRTIAGEECSAYFPAGTAQYHINADIAYALKQYVEVTGDDQFLLDYGAEILFETARLWNDVGDYIAAKDNQFCINEVTGPDEYTALVNNNYYTNAMAQVNLNYAYQVAEELKEDAPEEYQAVKEKISLSADEVQAWKEAADKMYLPYDEEQGIHKQDDSFLEKEVWDFANTPAEDYPLLLNYHPLVIYRYQVSKQADLVLALFLLGDQFSLEEKKRDFDYYEAVTTHDSSLSSCIHSIVAAEIGYYEEAYEYFMETARMDLDNYHNNSQHGVHTAAMAGTWMSVVNGFAGMRVYDGALSFAPYLPEEWDSYKFRITFKERRIEVEVKEDEVTYSLIAGSEIEFKHHDEIVTLTA